MTASLTTLYRQAEDYFFQSLSLKYLNIEQSITAYKTGIPLADLNPVYITKNINDFNKISNQIQQFYDQDNLAFVIIIPQEFCSLEKKNILKALGYFQTSKSLSMMVKLDNLVMDNAPRFKDETTIRPNDCHLKDWMIPLIGAFESTIDIGMLYAATHKVALKKNTNLRHFSLYKQEKPISSITLSVHNTLARIDDVGTLPEFQGRGYATDLVTYGLLEAKRLGVTHCFLEASESGFNIYQKLGFQILFKNNIYSKKLNTF